jgi:membrane protein DedA with SNARE-associated domain
LLADLVETLAAWMEEIVQTLGLPGVGLIAFVENLFPPTPSEFLYPLAGKLAYDGKLTPLGVIAAGIMGSLAGSLIYYGLGYRLGADRVRQGIVRFGQLRLWRLRVTIVSVEDYDRAVLLFQRRGGTIVLVARLVPLVHSVVSIPAGVTRMRLLPFVIYTVIGSALWIAPLTMLGMWLGSNWERILSWLDIYQNVWYGLMGLAVLGMIVRRVRARYRSSRTDPTE